MDLLQKIGKRLGLDLAFDANNRCVLMIDTDLIVAIDNQETYWSFHSVLTKAPEVSSPEFWQKLLSLNLELFETNRGTLALEAESQVLLYLTALTVADKDVDSIWEQFEAIIDTYESIFKWLHELEEDATEAKSQFIDKS